MVRPLAECGSFTAYKRHKRNGELVDEACAQAARDQKNVRVSAARDEVSNVVRLAIVNAPAVADSIDELDKARWNLRIVEATMEAGVPTGMAALSKQHADLVALIRRLEAAASPEVTALDRFAQRIAERRAASSN
jgi:hypothetical protein